MVRFGFLMLCIFFKAVPCHRITSDLSMQAAYKDEILELHKNNSIFKILGGIETQVTFYLYTRNQSSPEVINPRDASTLMNTKFKKEIATKFLIHGYLGDVNKEMIQNIKDRFLETQDVNVIAVDWGTIAVNVDYFAVARRTPSVGRYVAELLDLLVSYGCLSQDFHLIGHSLGAHIAGFAGMMASHGKPARITGLDPARPAFSSASPSERLDASDAQFVDCIHTCGGLLGIHEPICTADFYANGGKHAQPGCLLVDFGSSFREPDNLIFKRWWRPLTLAVDRVLLASAFDARPPSSWPSEGKCSHTRSHEYFAESILPGHNFPTLECPSLAEDLTDCVESPHIMGNYVKSSARGKFYVLTNSQYPYAPINEVS